ncbi:MAG: MBL fold metallo-hydrolase [bacterium]|nr:MBL fold metallo-hydrolase [bacterium]
MMRFTIGDHRFTLLDAGSLWLDGGAMFGVVPRTLWERQRRPDERNRIRLATNVLLIEDGKTRTLVDTGSGLDWDEKSRGIYGIEARTAEEMLEPAGLRPAQIDRVLNTHLHFDHAGGNTFRDSSGTVRAAFPNARYVVQRGELETARSGNERSRASYRRDDFEPLAEEADRLWLIDGDTDLGGGVSTEVAAGHTPHMQIVKVETGAGTVAFMADLFPTASHVPYAWIMAYDLEPLVTLETRKRIVPRAVREEWRVVFEHDDTSPIATLVEAETGRPTARPYQGDL